MNYEALLGLNITQFLLAFVRASGMLLSAPIYQNKTIPPTIRVFLALSLGIIVAPYVKAGIELETVSFWMAVSFLIQEVLVGIIMGLMVNMTFFAFQLAGYLFDVPIGFSMVNVLDAQSGSEVPLLAQFNVILASLIYLAIKGHHVLIIAFVKSYETVPPGGLLMKKEAVGFFVQTFTDVFLLGFKMGVPIIGTIFLVDLALGIISKLIPQINVFIVGFPVKILVGIFMLAVFIPAYVGLIEGCFTGPKSAFKTMQMMLELLTG